MARAGYVYDSYGAPISGVTVNAYRPDTRLPLATTTTDSRGNWSFEGFRSLPASAGYRIEIINGATTVEIENDRVLVTPPPAYTPAARPWWRRMWGT